MKKLPRKKNQSVLATQSKNQILHSKRLPFFALIILVAVLGNQHKKVEKLLRSKFLQWQSNVLLPEVHTTLFVHSNSPIDPISDTIITSIKNNEHLTKIQSSQSLAKILYRYGIFENVHISTIGLLEREIHLTMRTPLFCFLNEKIRLIDRHGIIYSLVQDASICQHGILHGISMYLPSPELVQLQKIHQDSLEILFEATDLSQQLTKHNIDILPNILYHKTRGFIVELDKPRIKVIFGRAPFPNKLKRLKSIANQNNINEIEKIELDYSNKVFVKRSKRENQSEYQN